MNRRRTLSAVSLTLAAFLILVPVASAHERSQRLEGISASFFADPLAFVGQWLGRLVGLEAAPATTTTACGEAGPHIDPNGCPAVGAATQVGPVIDPNGH